MKPVSLRTLVSAIGFCVAITTAISIPAGYLLVGYSNIADTTAFKARLNAGRLAKYIYTHDSLWQYQRVRLAEVIEIPEAEEGPVRQRVFDPRDDLLLEEGPVLASPVLTRGALIIVAGTPVGRLEVDYSLRDIVEKAAIAAAFSCFLGFGMFFAVRVFPLRVLDRTLEALGEANAAVQAANGQLQAQNTRFDAALNNMSQGLCMFNAAQKLTVVNQRFAAMFGLAPDNIVPGIDFGELLGVMTGSGNLSGESAEVLWKEQKNLIEQGTPDSILWDLTDGRSLSIVYQPMLDGGWVITLLDVSERRIAEAKLSHMARHDALTNLPNRTSFREQMEQYLSHLGRDQTFAVLCLDLDHFKSVNDTLGHPFGDMLLRQVGERLRHCIRESDSIARLGGDEFAILQGALTQPTEVTALATRLIEVIGAPYDLDGHQVVIGASLGIAIAPTDARDPDQLLKNADMALYRAKADGRNTYRFFEQEMDARMQARRTLEIDLRKALANDEFELYYQPVVTLKTGQVGSFEALLRWHHPERGMVPPLEFIPLAEETALIVPLGEWVLRKACAEAATWSQAIGVAVNLSPVQFKSRHLMSAVIAALAISGLPPQRLELEITETVLLQDSEATLATLHQLRSLGVRISMDDFGTGYSSLSYLRSFPFDKIKIDRSFVRDVLSKDGCAAIVRAVAVLGTSLGMETTAEGVETQEQLDYLRREGCTEVQGFLFSKPRPAGEVGKMLADIEFERKAVA
jgi:diguanylate cyclase (GGDEF)-like protein